MNTKLKKRKTKAFGKDVYLLGVDEQGDYIWLEEAAWDCGWYWGFGYIETYTNNKNPSKAKDIRSHSHYNGLVFHKDKNNNYLYHINEALKETVLHDSEAWELSDLMKSFYTLSKAAAVLGKGNSHYTTTTNADLTDKDMATKINEELLPLVFARVYEILSP